MSRRYLEEGIITATRPGLATEVVAHPGTEPLMLLVRAVAQCPEREAVHPIPSTG